MSGPYSVVITATGTTVASGTPLNLGALLAGYVGGSIVAMTVSTRAVSAFVNPTNVGVWIGPGGGPTVRIYWHHDIQGGAPWLVSQIRFDGLFSSGLEITTSTSNIWAVIQGTAQMEIYINLTIAPP